MHNGQKADYSTNLKKNANCTLHCRIMRACAGKAADTFLIACKLVQELLLLLLLLLLRLLLLSLLLLLLQGNR